MPTPVIIPRYISHDSGGRDRCIVYYEAKSREEFLELRDKIRSDESCMGLVIVLGGVLMVALFVAWLYK